MGNPAAVKFRLRVTRGDDIAVGPGKIDLLEAIDRTGSITAAAKALGMSYRRAWLLVDTMNRCFKSPVVAAESGGRRGGGTALTPVGADVVRRYRRIESAAARAGAADIRAFLALLAR
jgi:molybdate transport system regulatory protein